MKEATAVKNAQTTYDVTVEGAKKTLGKDPELLRTELKDQSESLEEQIGKVNLAIGDLEKKLNGEDGKPGLNKKLADAEESARGKAIEYKRMQDLRPFRAQSTMPRVS